MRALIIALLLLLPVTAQAQTAYVKPPNAPTAYISDYNVTIGVWVQGSGIGSYPAEFELHPDGKWYFADGDAQHPQNLDVVIPQTGALVYLTNTFAPAINAILLARFPPIGGGGPTGPGNMNDQVNALLGQIYAIKNVGGAVSVGLK